MASIAADPATDFGTGQEVLTEIGHWLHAAPSADPAGRGQLWPLSEIQTEKPAGAGCSELGVEFLDLVGLGVCLRDPVDHRRVREHRVAVARAIGSRDTS